MTQVCASTSKDKDLALFLGGGQEEGEMPEGLQEAVR
jgi:hypothetical protein